MAVLGVLDNNTNIYLGLCCIWLFKGPIMIVIWGFPKIRGSNTDTKFEGLLFSGNGLSIHRNRYLAQVL